MTPNQLQALARETAGALLDEWRQADRLNRPELESLYPSIILSALEKALDSACLCDCPDEPKTCVELRIELDLLRKRVKELEGELDYTKNEIGLVFETRDHLQAKCRDELRAERDELKRMVSMEQENAAVARAERDELRRKLDKAMDALRDLHDEQNGPPLVRREAQWTAAMEKAQAVLNELECASNALG